VAAIVGFGLPQPWRSRLQQLAMFFPAFKHFSVQDPGHVTLTDEIAHADGGAIENLGIMPLLARHVRNILVFDNTSDPNAEQNSDLQALFMSNAVPDSTSDTRYNKVFDSKRWDEMTRELIAARTRHEPQVYCGTGWEVLKNERYNIRPYNGLNICFVYNAAVPIWEESLLEPVRTLLKGSKNAPKGTGNLDNFPWFATFEQNQPHLIQLTTPQVNLFANLTAWTISNARTAKTIADAMPDLANTQAQP
jgi:hypothetical protein